MTEFNDLEFKPHPNDPAGVRAVMNFDNGYSASVVKTFFSYGGDYGRYELAVMKGGDLDYTTPITDDVEGHLTENGVTRLLKEIAALERPDE